MEAREDLKRPCFTIFKFQRPELIVRSVTPVISLFQSMSRCDRRDRAPIKNQNIGDRRHGQESFRAITSYARDGLPVRGCVFSGTSVVGTTDTSPHHSWKR